MTTGNNKTPKHLSREAKALWRRIQESYEIEDDAGLLILTTALEAHDRMKQAQAILDTDGLTVTDKFGQVKSHPLIPAERDARAAMLSALKALSLDLEPVKKPGRPAGRR